MTQAPVVGAGRAVTGAPFWAAPAVAGVLAAGAFAAVTLRGGSPSELVPLGPLGVLFVLAGSMAARRRAREPSGRLLWGTGLAWTASQAFLAVPNSLLTTLGLALFPLGLAFLAHLALAFPNGLASRSERVLTAVPYVLALAGLPVIEIGDCAHCGVNLVGVATESGFGRIWYAALLVAAIVTALCFLTVLVGRWRRGSVAARRVLLPVLPGACLFAAAYVVSLLDELGLPTGLGGRSAPLALLLLVAAPVVFLAGLLRAHLARAHVGPLMVELGATQPRGELREAVARALRDPTVEVARWRPEDAHYVDDRGAPIELPRGDSTRAVTVIERSGRPVGALVHDAALLDDQAHVDAVCAAAGLALENERLHAEVVARLEEVRASRARIVEAGDAARRRVERNLHDGAQQRLVALSIMLGMARANLGAGGGPEVERLLSQAAEEATRAIAELRELARGLHPSILREVGLVGALESLVERSPVPVTLRAAAGGALPAPVEDAAYFVVAESLTNVAKYAGASSVEVRVEQSGGTLLVEVADDGAGGATVSPGSGLEGLADRVAALGGRFDVDSPAGGGTRVRAELPCG